MYMDGNVFCILHIANYLHIMRENYVRIYSVSAREMKEKRAICKKKKAAAYNHI